jgi:putative two-component system response regulator
MNSNIRKNVLVVDDEPAILLLLERLLEDKYHIFTATDGLNALDVITQNKETLNLVITDIKMPKMDGISLLKEIHDRYPRLGVMMISAHGDINTAVEVMKQGARDYIPKPLPEFGEIERRIESYLESQEWELEMQDYARNVEYAMLLGLAKLAESKDPETGKHLFRVQTYTRFLAQQLATQDKYRDILTPDVIDNLARSSILHDIGKVGIPDVILLKPGPLTPDEQAQMKEHATIGGETLKAAEAVLIGGETFLSTGRNIAFHHHEKHNGMGYPFGLSGEDIPLAARVVALADVYDALTSKRPYKEAFPHETAKQIISEDRGLHFHSDIVDAFLQRERDFNAVQKKHTD